MKYILRNSALSFPRRFVLSINSAISQSHIERYSVIAVGALQKKKKKKRNVNSINRIELTTWSSSQNAEHHENYVSRSNLSLFYRWIIRENLRWKITSYNVERARANARLRRRITTTSRQMDFVYYVDKR